MPNHPPESRRLYRQVADQITQLIEDGDYQRGARLPPERDLAKRLGVSRPSLREALIALEVEGYVDVRVGSGVYVQDPAPTRAAAASALDHETGPFELLVTRRLVESECAALAARCATTAQVDAIEHSLDAMIRAAMHASSSGAASPLDEDHAFHLRIAQASNNSALLLLVQTLWAERAGPLFVRLEHHFNSPGLWLAAIDEHRDIVRAIAARNPSAARSAMRRHMDQAARRFARNWMHAGKSAPPKESSP
jgi:DNA-binding FadR family transcriptional regulator